mmetsp:Transcript_56572/g.132719  ORF Transcript_56572/g.132719 Transcript_56572/m.132719 type:complete len:350 (-) Transcript_56572:91-1140(-)
MSGPYAQRPAPNPLDQLVEGVSTWFNGLFAPPQQQRGAGGSKVTRDSSIDRKHSGQWAGSSVKEPQSRDGSSQRSTTAGSSSGGYDGQMRRPSAYVADKEDLLDQHVAYYFKHHPEVYNLHRVARVRPGVYELNGREIYIEWEYATEPGAQGHLVVQDGPLRQPFADYMKMTETNAEYDVHSLNQQAALHMIPQERRLTFGDHDKAYTRLEAMKVAKEQANFREQAANYMHTGQQVPQDLMNKYEKKINQKLGGGSRQRQRSTSRSALPANSGSPMAAPSPMQGVPNSPMPAQYGGAPWQNSPMGQSPMGQSPYGTAYPQHSPQPPPYGANAFGMPGFQGRPMGAPGNR